MLICKRENLSEPSASALRQMIMGFRTTHLIHAAAALGLTDLVADAPQTSADLALRTGTDAGAMYRLLRALASLGIFTELSPGRFGLTPLGEFLKRDALGSLPGLALLYGQDWYLEAYGAMSDSGRFVRPWGESLDRRRRYGPSENRVTR